MVLLFIFLPVFDQLLRFSEVIPRSNTGFRVIAAKTGVSVQRARKASGSVEHIGGDVAAVFGNLGQHGLVQPDIHFG